jgi:LmbE family N-acetylglucosaminyl deacetylase
MVDEALPGGKLMVVGAHAGDAENMAGAAVLKHTRAGHQAIIVHMTLGEAGHPTRTPNAYAEQRKMEIHASAALLGARTVCLGYADGLLPADDQAKLRLCDVIREENPSAIITHWRGSLHKDHTATYEIVRDAIFYAALPAIRRARAAHRVPGLYFAENWEDMDSWRADLYLDVSSVWEDYLGALRAHELMRGGISSFRYLEYYDALGTTRGCLGGFAKAVALMLPPGGWVRKLQYLPGLQPAAG